MSYATDILDRPSVLVSKGSLLFSFSLSVSTVFVINLVGGFTSSLATA